MIVIKKHKCLVSSYHKGLSRRWRTISIVFTHGCATWWESGDHCKTLQQLFGVWHICGRYWYDNRFPFLPSQSTCERPFRIFRGPDGLRLSCPDFEGCQELRCFENYRLLVFRHFGDGVAPSSSPFFRGFLVMPISTLGPSKNCGGRKYSPESDFTSGAAASRGTRRSFKMQRPIFTRFATRRKISWRRELRYTF